MTNKAREEPDLARFLQDWTELWRDELNARANDPAGMADAMELWRSAMTAWTGALGMPPMAAARDHAGPPGAEAAAAASDARDDEVRRLTRRVDELEARLAKLEPPRRRGRASPLDRG
jgi:hypothetical protein